MSRPVPAEPAQSSPHLLRSRAKLAQARAAGILGETKDARIASRVSSDLLAAARRRAGSNSDSEVIEIALATLALEDDFGEKLVRLKGSVPGDIDLGF
jgi:hypothetical protein